MVCEDIGAAVLEVSVLGKGCESILGLFRRVSVPFQVHQVSSSDWEQLLLLCLLVCIVFCLGKEERMFFTESFRLGKSEIIKSDL